MLTYLPRRPVRRGLAALLTARGRWALGLAVMAFLFWSGLR